MKLFSYLFLFFLPCLAMSQQAESNLFDERLLVAYDATYLTRLAQEQPIVLRRLEFYLDHAFYITEDAKTSRFEYPTIKINDLNAINILQLEREQHLRRHPKQEKAYRIEGTEQVLVYLSAEDFTKAFNQSTSKIRLKTN